MMLQGVQKVRLRHWFSLLLFCWLTEAQAAQLLVKDIARIHGVRENALTGYGLVVGLAGSGDSARFVSTSQSLKSLLRSFDVNIEGDAVKSRNVAAVMITATIPAFAEVGDKLDIRVSSLGDARSLNGGTLIISPLKAPNGETYALAQGQITVGGYHFEQDQNIVAKNHSTVGNIIRGATVERAVIAEVFAADGSVSVLLNQPDFTVLEQVATAIEQHFPELQVNRVHAGRLQLQGPLNYRHLAQLEQLRVQSNPVSRIVVNERSGVIVSGADIPVSSVVISHGSLQLNVRSQPRVSQPGGLVIGGDQAGQTLSYRDTEIRVDEQQQQVFISQTQTDIADVVEALQRLNIPTRDVISILEAMKRSGALQAEIVIQ
jgi:flagellar P-ring protein precursor FlgI